MRFQVPQFIEIEDKIFGPLSFKQFIYLVGGAGIAYALYRLLPLFIAILFIAPILGLAGALAFYQVNGKPFIHTLEAAFHYLNKKKLYLWQKSERKNTTESKTKKEATAERAYNPITVPRLSESRLKDMSWSLEVERETSTNKTDTN
ncbi:MAG: PrgI family protein [Candidatus Paceibacterota bacterium]